MLKHFARMFVLVVSVLTIASLPSMAQGGQGGGQGGGRGAGGGRGGGGGGIVTLTVTSSSFADGGEIAAKFTGQQGVSPQLSWSGAPAGTASFVLIMHDVDAAFPAQNLGSDITHWVVWNIPGSTTSI